MDKRKVLLIFGGESSEHEVSIASATNVNQAIDREKYEVLLCYIDREGHWWLCEDFEDYQDLSKARELVLSPGRATIVTLTGERIEPQVILPILHGRNGEDGSLQGLAQLMHIPIVGCDVTAASICMDKVAAKEIAAQHGITIVPYMVHHATTPPPSFEEVQKELGMPVFVKPVRAGSSVGITKVKNAEQWQAALDEAHRHDPMVLIEKAMTIREIEVAVLGTPPNHQASVPGEIKPGQEFYSYDDKYDEDSTSTAVIPAELDNALSQEISDMAAKIFAAIGCKGLARIDFFLTEKNEIYLNEINTLPGFTNISMYPKLWQQAGMSYTELIDKLIMDAVE